MATFLACAGFVACAAPLIAGRFVVDCMVSLARYQREQRERRAQSPGPPATPRP